MSPGLLLHIPQRSDRFGSKWVGQSTFAGARRRSMRKVCVQLWLRASSETGWVTLLYWPQNKMQSLDSVGAISWVVEIGADQHVAVRRQSAFHQD